MVLEHISLFIVVFFLGSETETETNVIRLGRVGWV